MYYIRVGRGMALVFFFSSRRGHTIWPRDWSSDVCSSDLQRDHRSVCEPVHGSSPPGLNREREHAAREGEAVEVSDAKTGPYPGRSRSLYLLAQVADLGARGLKAASERGVRGTLSGRDRWCGRGARARAVRFGQAASNLAPSLATSAFSRAGSGGCCTSEKLAVSSIRSFPSRIPSW